MGNKILFYGPLSITNRAPDGGGERGNARTIQLLENRGFDVLKVKKPKPFNIMLGKVLYPVQLLCKVFEIGLKLLSNRSLSFLHVSGFYKNLIYSELLIILLAKAFGRTSIYELRAGGVIEAYNSRSTVYRYCFNLTLKQADRILCQGKKYIEFLTNLSGKGVIHYPNFVESSYSAEFKDERSTFSDLNLIHFGRLCHEKNTLLILEICQILKARGVEFKCSIIGESTSEFQNLLRATMHQLNVSDCVVVLPKRPIEYLMLSLQKMHFFLFPSKEKREGQSNALTEAMHFGVVPIVSKCGFNREVVGRSEFVIQEFCAEKYADKIVSIWEGEQWKESSLFVSNRIKNEYSQKTAERNLLTAYSSIFSK